MIEITWGTAVTFVVLVAAIAPGFYHLGRIGKQVERNTSDIKVIFSKLDDIHNFVKNGGRHDR